MWKEEARRKGEESKESGKEQGQKNVEKIGTQKVLEVGKGIWKKGDRKNASVKDLGPRHRVKRRVLTEEGKVILIVERRKGRSASVCGGSVEERIHLTFQVTPNVTSTLCGKKGWHMENSAGLSAHKSVNNKEWVSLTSHYRHTGWSRKEEDVYKAGSEIGIQ